LSAAAITPSAALLKRTAQGYFSYSSVYDMRALYHFFHEKSSPSPFLKKVFCQTGKALRCQQPA
jgi:hypothetical protein